MVAMMSPLHRAPECPFCVCQLLAYIFANCSQTPASTSNLSTFSESQWNVDSNDTLSVRKYYQLFTHKSNTFLLQNTSLQPLGKCGQTTPKSTFPLEARGPRSGRQPRHWSWNKYITTLLIARLHSYINYRPCCNLMWHPDISRKHVTFAGAAVNRSTGIS